MIDLITKGFNFKANWQPDLLLSLQTTNFTWNFKHCN